jgi:hypothetical protein
VIDAESAAGQPEMSGHVTRKPQDKLEENADAVAIFPGDFLENDLMLCRSTKLDIIERGKFLLRERWLSILVTH